MAGRWRTGKLVPVAIGLSLLISVPETAARLRCRRLLAQHGKATTAPKSASADSELEMYLCFISFFLFLYGCFPYKL